MSIYNRLLPRTRTASQRLDPHQRIRPAMRFTDPPTIATPNTYSTTRDTAKPTSNPLSGPLSEPRKEKGEPDTQRGWHTCREQQHGRGAAGLILARG
jgi:hypothetical protein